MKIKIGAHQYEIVERSRAEDGMLNDGNYAYTLETGNMIVVDRDISMSKKQVTIMHELLHAIRFVNDGFPKPRKKDSFDDWEHYFINMYENNLLAILKDNVELTDWLLK